MIPGQGIRSSLSGLYSFFIVFLCMNFGVGVGAADVLGRQRNIFPLPEISDGDGAGPSSGEWRVFANQGIKALNEIAGCVNADFHVKKKTTRAQRRVLHHIAGSYRAACQTPFDEGLEGGLRGLCSSARLYDSGRTDVQAYAREKVSWPEVSSQPIPLAKCLPSGDRERLGHWATHMLRSKDDVLLNAERVVPYIDPILKHNQTEYAGFLQELLKRNMVGFRTSREYESMLGIFFVKKKTGQQRLIFDTRRLNQLFEEPPNTDLPSAEAFTRLETVENESFYIASGDLANAFYTLAVPEELGHMFTLPLVSASLVGINTIDGVPIAPRTQVVPYLRVLPMGWSWALHLCQQVLMHAIDVAGFSPRQIIGDKRAAVQLSARRDTAVAGYVDNFGVFGSDKETVDQGLAGIITVLRGWGLTVHEVGRSSTQH